MPCTLRLRDRIVAVVNKMISRVTHKHGVDLPTLVSHSKKIDDINGNTMCVFDINREIETLKITFDVLEDGAKIPVCHNKSSGTWSLTLA